MVLHPSTPSYNIVRSIRAGVFRMLLIASHSSCDVTCFLLNNLQRMEAPGVAPQGTSVSGNVLGITCNQAHRFGSWEPRMCIGPGLTNQDCAEDPDFGRRILRCLNLQDLRAEVKSTDCR